ncbi:retrovirus-related pol polyprotein from transposon TNT 1-94 [Tanacetum coccineum]
MHNNIMAASSRDRPPMLATGRYDQWQSRFMRYVDTKPNGEALRKFILQGPYKLSNIIIPGQPVTGEYLKVPERTVIETFSNISPENKAHYDAEKEAIHLLLTEIGDAIYVTVDACKTAHGMWIAIERQQHGESLNKQDVETSLFWEFGRFTSRDGESIESYYSRFYKMMNEMVRNQSKVATMQVNVQFLQQLQPEWSRFVTIVKQTEKLDTISYHKLFDILKQYQKEVNEIRAEKIARNTNPLALVAVAQQYLDTYYQEPKPQKKPKRAKDYTYHKQKMLMCKQAEKGVPLQAEHADWLEDMDEEVDEQELEAHYSSWKRFRRQHSEQPESINDIYVMEKVDSNVIPDSLDKCDNDNQADQNDKECKDERVVLANLIANLKLDTDENKRIQKQLKKANTSLSHELQECKSALEECKSSLEKSNRTRDRYLGALHDKEVELEKYKIFKDRTIEKDTLECNLNETLGLLAQKEHDIKVGLKIKAYEVSVVKEKHDELVKQSLLTKSSYEGLVKEKNKSIQTIHMLSPKGSTYNGRPTFANPMYLKKAQSEKPGLYEIPYYKCDLANLFALDKEETLTLEQESRSKLNKVILQNYNIAISELKKLIEKCKGKSVETKFDKPSIVRQPNALRIPKPSVLGKPTPFLDSLKRKSFSKTNLATKTNVSGGLSKPFTTQILPQTARQAVRNTNVIKPGMYQIDTMTTQTRASQSPQTSINTNPRVSTSTGVIHNTSASRPQLRSTQMKEKVMQDSSQVKSKKTEVEDHHRISSISNKTKYVTACNDSLKSKTLNVNIVCAICGKCIFNSNHDTCVSKFLNDVNAKSKKPQEVPIRLRKPIRKSNQSVATPPKKTIASDSTIKNSKSYYRMPYEKTSKIWKWWIEEQWPLGYKWVLKTKMKWVPKVRKEDVNISISPTIDNASRITNVLKLINTLGSNLSNVSSSSNYLADFETHPIHLRFWNDKFAPILGYEDLVQGNITIKRVYFVEGLNHNLFLVGQFCDADIEVAFRKSTCLKDIVNGLLKLKYVKDQLCSSYELSKVKKSTFKTKTVPSSKGRLNLLYMDLCGPIRIESINGRKYVLVIVDDYSRYTWTLFLRTKDETPEVLKDFLNMIQRNLQAQKKASNIKLPLLEHLNRIALSKDGTVLSLRLLERCFQLLNFLYSFGLKLQQPRVTLRTDLSLSPDMKRHHIISSMAENLLLNTFTSLVALELIMTSDDNTSGLTPHQQKASDYDNYSLAPQLQKTYDHNRSELGIQDHNNEPSSSMLVSNVSPPVDINALSLQEL